MRSGAKAAEPRRPVPRLYLIAPAQFSGAVDVLEEALSTADVAAVLLRLPHGDGRAKFDHVKAVAPSVQGRGMALVLDGYPELALEAHADGAHVEGVASLNTALAKLKPGRIVGCGALRTRHDAMVAGEAGADYVMFGEPDAPGGQRSFAAVSDRVAWWAELFEIPCVGFAVSLDEVNPLAAAGADFVAVGDFIFADRRGCGAALADAARRIAERTP
jgi:thiamine-phosphate pyrophosphorylase